LATRTTARRALRSMGEPQGGADAAGRKSKMRRRTKPRVVWLPPTNANSIPLSSATSGFQEFFVGVASGTGPVAGEIPLTIDSQDDPLDPNTSLADIESTGYRLRRIVGKIWIDFVPSDESSIISVICTAGLIVRRSDPATGQSFATQTGLVANLSPQHIGNFGDPWIWRRSWVLFNAQAAVIAGFEGPVRNYGPEAGSAVDGPHVDQKTARIVGPEERVFLTVGLSVLETTAPQSAITEEVRVVTDLRLLASMRSSSGNRRNASR